MNQAQDAPDRDHQKDDDARGLECGRCGCRMFDVYRTVKKRDAIVRTRHCRHCGRRVVTWEKVIGEPDREEI